MTDEWLTRAQFLELYKIAIEEYRFEVTLNNDRTFRYLIFNAAALSVGTGLLKTGSAPITDIFVCLLFVAGAMTARLGIRSVIKGHEYYRRAVYKKTLLEAMLGLHQPLRDPQIDSEMMRLGVKTDYPGATAAIATTAGQSEIEEILQRPEEWIRRPLRKKTIVRAAVFVLWVLFVSNILASLLAIFMLLQTLL